MNITPEPTIRSMDSMQARTGRQFAATGPFAALPCLPPLAWSDQVSVGRCFLRLIGGDGLEGSSDCFLAELR